MRKSGTCHFIGYGPHFTMCFIARKGFKQAHAQVSSQALKRTAHVTGKGFGNPKPGRR